MRPQNDVVQEPGGRGWSIAVSLFLGLLLKQLPWSGWGLLLRPDFLLLAVLFWALHRPSRIGMGAAFGLGLLSDFQDGVVLGQHALAYVVGVYAVQYFRLRLLQFDAARQSAQMLPVFLLVQFVILIVGWLAVRPPNGGAIFVLVLSETALWYLVVQALFIWYGKNAFSRR